MRYLITGGAGFIGSHLTESLLADGHEVYVMDDLSTGRRENLTHLENDPTYRSRLFVFIDTILNRDALLELVGTCDVVVHLAAAVGVKKIIDNPLSSIVTNVQGTEIILELCQRFKKAILLASTSEVYGKHDHSPLVETDDCVYGHSQKFRWSYAAGKLMDEFTGLAYHRTHGLPVYVARLFNTVGPRQTGEYGMVIPRFVKQALENKPITIFGDGQQTRTFTHVQEVVTSLRKLLETKEAEGQVVNIGGVEEVSILELARRVKNLTGSQSQLRLIPYDEAYPKDFEDMQRRVPSTEKLRGLVDYAPSMRLDEILLDVIRHARTETSKESYTDHVPLSAGTAVPANEHQPL